MGLEIDFRLPEEHSRSSRLIEDLENGNRTAPFLRARALNAARRAVLDGVGIEGQLQVPVTRHLVGAFELYGLG
jgi:hypothetical protein